MEFLSMLLPILWVILKFILYVVIAVILIALLLIAIILISPIKYNGRISYENGLESLDTSIGVSWIAKIITMKLAYKNSTRQYIIRIFGVDFTSKIMGILKKKDKKVVDDAKSLLNHTPPMASETTTEDEMEASSALGTEFDNSRERQNLEGESETKIKFSTKLDKIKWKIKRIYAMIRKIWIVREKIITIFQLEIHRRTLEKLKEVGIYLCYRLVPHKVVGQARFGFDDPSFTGRVLAGYSMLLPILGQFDLDIEPEFNDEVLELDLDISGKIYIRHLIKAILKIVLDKGSRHTFKTLKRIKL